ncbi:MAG: NTPase [bacterium]
MKKNLLITGPPGVGKTTAIRKIAEGLAECHPAGFYTEEIRSGERRVGFKIETLDGREGVLSHVEMGGPHRVGRYGVDVRGFEGLAIPAIDPEVVGARVIIIDEIGRMETFSKRFCELLTKIADSERVLIATIAQRGGGMIAELKGREDVEVFEMTRANRDSIPQRVVDRARELLR